MLRHEDIIDYSTETGTMIYKDCCKALTTPFDMKYNGTVIHITELQTKCNRTPPPTPAPHGCHQLKVRSQAHLTNQHWIAELFDD